MKILARYILPLMALFVWGCAGTFPGLTVEAPKYSVDEEVRLGKAAAPYVLQLLGGPYPDAELQIALDKTLKPLARQHARQGIPFSVAIADRTEPRLDVLSGGRIIVSRGLLARMESLQGLERSLEYALTKSLHVPFGGEATRELIRASGEVLSGEAQPSRMSPAYPPVTLARAFVERESHATSSYGSGEQLPPAWERLKETRPAYDVLAQGKQVEANGDLNTAIALYLQAAAVAPDEADILGELGMAYLRADDLRSARIYLEKSVRLQPSYYRTRMGLGYLALQRGQLEEAGEHLKESVKLLPVTENLYLLAQAYEGQGDLKRAKALYENIVAAGGRSKLVKAAKTRVEELEK